jgi:hypothetical protein
MEQQKILLALETLSKTAASPISMIKAWRPVYELGKKVLGGGMKVNGYGEGARILGKGIGVAMRKTPIRSAAAIAGIGAGGALVGRKLID